jgi:hypothetical protein
VFLWRQEMLLLKLYCPASKCVLARWKILLKILSKHVFNIDKGIRQVKLRRLGYLIYADRKTDIEINYLHGQKLICTDIW